MAAQVPPADLLPVSRKANLPFRAIRLIGTAVVRAVFRVRVTGRANVPREGNYIVVGNHLGWLDWA